MNNIIYSSILCSAVFAVACCDKKTGTSSTQEAQQSEVQVTKSEFKREVYTSIKFSGNEVRLISATECEIEEGGKSILATYTVEDKKMRFVFTAFGGQRVMYANVYSDGIVMNEDNEVYLTAEGLRQKEENDRMLREKMERIGREAPTVLIGEWEESQTNADNPDVIVETSKRVFNADGSWSKGGETGRGKWNVEENSNRLVMNRGPFVIESKTYAIVDLAPDHYIIEMHESVVLGNANSFIATLKGKRINPNKAVKEGAK